MQLSVLWESSTNEQKKKSKIGKVPVKIDDVYPQSRMDKDAVPGLFLTGQFDKKWPSKIWISTIFLHFSESLGFVDVCGHYKLMFSDITGLSLYANLAIFVTFSQILCSNLCLNLNFTGFSKKWQFSSRGFHKFLT